MMELQNQWLERTNAMEIAWSREFVRYYGAFCAVSTVGLCVGCGWLYHTHTWEEIALIV
jgi:hypothetical protein